MRFSESSAVGWIVAGLGNPGKRYERTRHNLGFLAADLLAEREGAKLNRLKFQSACALFSFAGEKCLVMKPQTYMNLSGEAVRAAVSFYRVPPERVLVLFDDVSLPVGKVRVRPGGSAGGHNGVKNLIAHLGTQDFPRVKIGAGAPPSPDRLVDWVTDVPSQADWKLLQEAIVRAVDAAACVISQGCAQAMNDFNG